MPRNDKAFQIRRVAIMNQQDWLKANDETL
jgi:hypothetical protein